MLLFSCLQIVGIHYIMHTNAMYRTVYIYITIYRNIYMYILGKCMDRYTGRKIDEWMDGSVDR